MAGIIGAIGSVYKALRSALTRTGVNVGGTADYPRVEIHSIVESAWLDKGSVKTITCIVECISDRRMQDVLDMNEENLKRMLGVWYCRRTGAGTYRDHRHQGNPVQATSECNYIC